MAYSKETHRVGIRKACSYFELGYSVMYYKKRTNSQDDLIREELRLLAEQEQTWGFWLMRHRLKNLGFWWNHKRIYRIYTSMKLNLRTKRRKRLPARLKEPLLRPIYPNVTRSMDFMRDTLENGRKARSLNVMDDLNREILQSSIDTGLPSAKVIARLGELIEWRGRPEKVRVDNGPEFIAEKLKGWCAFHGIELHFIQP